MSLAEAIKHLTLALLAAKPGCYEQVSPHALAIVLAEHEKQQGEEADG